VTFFPQFKINILGNHRPVIRNMDVGIWSRIRLVPFLRIFSEEEQDKTLKDRFRDEAEHILAWMLQGCLEWQQRGLDDVPEAIAKATSEYKTDMDVIGEWILDRCTERSDVSSMASVLYGSYRDWADKNGHKNPMTAQMFGRRLSDRGLRRTRTINGSLWKGICISI
jgi:P4 family phage/plasmid primase-like protien